MKRGNTRFPRQGARWTLAELKQLGRTPDSVLARREGRPIREAVAMRVSRRVALPTPGRRWTARESRLLGTKPDAEVARRLRHPDAAVRLQRLALKIPAFKFQSLYKSWTSAEIRLVGTAADPEIARRLGCALHVVQACRYSRWPPSEQCGKFPRTIRLSANKSTARHSGFTFEVRLRQALFHPGRLLPSSGSGLGAVVCQLKPSPASDRKIPSKQPLLRNLGGRFDCGSRLRPSNFPR